LAIHIYYLLPLFSVMTTAGNGAEATCLPRLLH